VKNLKIVSLTIILLLVAIVVGCSNNMTSSSKGIRLIEAGKYEEASELLHEKDINLYNYCQSRIYYDKGNYLIGNTYLDDIQDTYSGALYQEVANFKAEMKEKNVEFGFQELTNNNYDKSINWFHELSKYDTSFEKLENYAQSIKYYHEGNYFMARYFAERIGSYSGYGEQEVKEYSDKILKELTSEVIANNREQLQTRAKSVQLGMNQQQVRESSWGNPNKINTTTTSYGVHEQWVYSGYNYLYFENGILTSIQN